MGGGDCFCFGRLSSLPVSLSTDAKFIGRKRQRRASTSAPLRYSNMTLMHCVTTRANINAAGGHAFALVEVFSRSALLLAILRQRLPDHQWMELRSHARAD